MGKEITCAIFGHRQISGRRKIELKLAEKLEALILSGVKNFFVGLHGEFDKLAISNLRTLKEKYSYIDIFIVVTDLSKLKKDKTRYSKLSAYEDLKIISYEIENIYFKNRIIFSNKKMVEQSDIILCYVDFKKNNSGAKKAVQYAKKQSKLIINIYEESDSILYGMNEKQIVELYEKIFNK